MTNKLLDHSSAKKKTKIIIQLKNNVLYHLNPVLYDGATWILGSGIKNCLRF